MREYSIDARRIKNPIYKATIDMGGCDRNGKKLEIGNYYLQYDGKPFFAICGEAHFSRINAELWEDEIIKMKQGGLNIIASYIFWIHHEEEEGKFDWQGNKNLRKFLEICKKHKMYMILRIGPFSHGECRNGGFPDWMFGKPFDIRCDNPEYLKYTKRFFKEIYAQAEGLLFKDGGPVIGVQLENEHEHASCPWEMTTENSKEWVVSGRDGISHMATLKKMAKEVGFDVPLYTATAWGGACAPVDTVFPLWGGYAFRPWMFYDGKLKEHPATAEYLYGDFHSNTAPKYYNFDPEYPAEDFPYACCEMGGGMNVYYPYRFKLPMESVGALAQVKTGSGCNFLGYYMYHGGTHPKGKKVPYLNECAVPKFSYDYQAPLGEFGQVRASYHFLKEQHLFYHEFQEEFVATKTVLSKEALTQKPEDVETLRYVVRVDEEGKGFLFLNNYQDHVEGIEQKDFSVEIHTDKGIVRVPEKGSINLGKECCAILPLWFEMHGNILKYATVQLVTRIKRQEADYYIFAGVGGMQREFVFESITTFEEIEGCSISGSHVQVKPKQCGVFSFMGKDGKKCVVVSITEEDIMNLWQLDTAEGRRIIFSEVPVLYRDEKFEMEYTTGKNINLSIFPCEKNEITVSGKQLKCIGNYGIFKRFETFSQNKELEYLYEDRSTINKEGDGKLKRPVVGSPVSSTKIVNARAILKFEPEDFENVKQLILKIKYEGDIGYAFCNGEMFHDNFCNGELWEIDILPYKEEILKYGMYIYISPKKQGAYVDNSSAMAARFEVVKEQVAEIQGVSLEAIQMIPLELENKI